MNNATIEDVTGLLGHIEGHVQHARDELVKCDQAGARQQFEEIRGRADAAIEALNAPELHRTTINGRPRVVSIPESEGTMMASDVEQLRAVYPFGGIDLVAREAETMLAKRDALIEQLIAVVRKAMTACKCRGTGVYDLDCSYCDDSTCDHVCKNEEVECKRPLCVETRSVVAAVEALGFPKGGG